jgi:hypothetical protein
MRRRVESGGFVVRAGVTLVLFLLAGCGGGGGGGGAPASYHVLSLHRDLVGDTVWSLTARYVAGGGGSLVQGEGYSSEGGGLSAQADLPFMVNASRDITAAPAWGAPVVGRMAMDRVFGAATATTAGVEPDLLVVARRNPNPQLSDLVGEWFVLAWTRSPGGLGGSSASCSLFEAQITVGAVFSFTMGASLSNMDGTVMVTPPSFATLDPVAILAGGWVSVLRGSGVPMQGSLSSDGRCMLLGTVGSGLVGVPSDAEVWILLRRGLANDTAQALGSVAVAGLQRSTSADFACLSGTGSFVGPIGGTSSLLGNVDGVLTPPFFPDLSLNIQVSGRAYVGLGGVSLEGASGPAGGYLATVGGFAPGDEPGLFLFVR